MVAHYASSRVPRFASLIDFMRAKKLCLRLCRYHRALHMPLCPAPGPERTNLQTIPASEALGIVEQRLRRHGIPPDYFTIQIAFKQQNQTFGRHIRLT